MVNTSASTSSGCTLVLVRNSVGPSWKSPAFRARDLAGGVNNQRQAAELLAGAQPVDQLQSVAVRQGQVEDDQVGASRFTQLDRILQPGSMVDNDPVALKGGENDARQVEIILDEQNRRMLA